METQPSIAVADEELAGEVTAIIFTNPSTGFGVVEVSDPDGLGGSRASGPLADLSEGQPVRLVGRWVDHPRYGATFEVDYYHQAQPQSRDGLIAFLSSARFRGIGEARARSLVDAFGLDLSQVIEREPERLAAVRGISLDLARSLAGAWREAGALAALVQELVAAGVPATVAQAAYRRFGDDAAQILAEDPYRLLDVRGGRWAHAEALATAAGVAPDDPRRLTAAAVSGQRRATARGGHMACVRAEVLTETRRLLRVAEGTADDALTLAVERGLLCVADRNGAGEAWWYTPQDLAAEQGLAQELARLLAARSRLAGAPGWEPSPELTPEQQEAVGAALQGPLTVLTGGPGTGKTRTITEVVRACAARDFRVALCAPTGRAAKRLTELTGHEATTIHRLLEARPHGESFAFGYDATRRLPHDMIVADEWSMADTRLAWALASAVDSGAHLLLVGDADQLPSVGAGAVLRDLLAADSPVETVRLTQIHRQAAASRIVTLAHEINAGRVPPLRGRMGDVFCVPERTDRVADRVAEIVAVRAPAFFGCGPADVQVLAPMYRGPAGVTALNRRLKERLNPARGRPAVGGFHEGDRVLATRNDAELDVANGDIGEVARADPADRVLEVAFPYGAVTYPADRIGDLAPAWCLTVHKSQGGEWPVVVLVLDPGHQVMLWRELVYTAVTRAAHGLLLVGDPDQLARAATRTGAGTARRRTRLTARLVAATRDVQLRHDAAD